MPDDHEASIAELLAQVGSLPPDQRARLRDLARQAEERNRRIAAQVERLQKVLDNLRLGVKYTLFDLEATRRENAALRERLGEPPTG